MITVSIVSHGHRDLVKDVLHDLAGFPEISSVVLTLNIPEEIPVFPSEIQSKLILISNDKPKGFGANHNAAFELSTTPYYCVLNPDVRMRTNPFNDLVSAMVENHAAMAAPLVMNSNGAIEDSIRKFPTPARLFAKAIFKVKSVYSISDKEMLLFPDWVAGMFMLFESKAFANLHGFDESFFLYYEDVDICARMRKQGMRLAVCPNVAVVHDAQRASHRNTKYLYWHICSMILFFIKHLGRLPSPNKVSGTV